MTAFNFGGSHDTDKSSDTHACVLTLFGEKETDNNTNIDDHHEESFFNFGNTGTDDMPDFGSSAFSLF